jgi:polar amino acid transport system substrate-binding protein
MTARARVAVAVALAAAAVALAACAAPRDVDVATAVRGLDVTPSASPSPTPTPVKPCHPLDSLRPNAPLPAPGQMPARTYMYTLQHTIGHLTVGVDQNTQNFGFLDPGTGNIEGFEVDVAREIAKAIFGPTDLKDHLQLRAMVTSQRIPMVKSGDVDMVVDAVTMTCARWGDVDFSTEYYEAHQRTLVRSDTAAATLDDLQGHKGCATAGSTSVQTLADHGLLPVQVAARTDCLVALETGQVDAIQADDTILLGFQLQDPATKLLPSAKTDEPEPYGIAIAKDHQDFVRFVNGVLDQMRRDGRWAAIYKMWLGSPVPKAPTPQYMPGAGS